jgi:hypothetical protein
MGIYNFKTFSGDYTPRTPLTEEGKMVGEEREEGEEGGDGIRKKREKGREGGKLTPGLIQHL